MSSNSGKIRFVRCPKCLQLLIEYSNVPLYQCGGCGMVLKAKNKALMQEKTNDSPEETLNSLNQPENISPDSLSIISGEPNNTPSSKSSEKLIEAENLIDDKITKEISSLDEGFQPNSCNESLIEHEQEKDEKLNSHSVVSEGEDTVNSTINELSNQYDASISSCDDARINLNDRSYYLQKSRRTFKKREGLPPKPLNEKFNVRYGDKEIEQGVSLDSNDFQIIQSFVEKDGASFQSPSSKFKNLDRTERLKKMDELRDQLSRFSKQKGGDEKKYNHKGIDPNHRFYYQNPSNNISQESPLCFDLRHTNQSKLPYYPPVTYPPTQCSCFHCINGLYRPNTCNFCTQSSFSGSPRSFDRESMKSSFKDKRSIVRRHIHRPISGGTPFVICKNCFKLLQVPSDILISRKGLTKLQCGGCSEVLTIPFPDKGCTNKKRMERNGEEEMEGTSGVPQVDPVSINEEYGASFTRSYSTGAESVMRGRNRDASGSALHRLMGYDSATDLLYSRTFFDDGYESFESMVPNSYRRYREAI